VAGRVATGASCWQEMEIADLLDAAADVVMVEMSTRELGHCCICAEGVAIEHQSGGVPMRRVCKNGSKRLIATVI
jgi:hypothetical protein